MKTILAAIGLSLTSIAPNKSNLETKKTHPHHSSVKTSKSLKVSEPAKRAFLTGQVALGQYGPGVLATNGYFKLQYQGDGNLVLYWTGPNPRVLWASGPLVTATQYVEFTNQEVRIYGGDKFAIPEFFWRTGNRFASSAIWVLQADGNFVMYYNQDGQTPIIQPGQPGFVYTGSISTGTAGGAVSSHWGQMR